MADTAYFRLDARFSGPSDFSRVFGGEPLRSTDALFTVIATKSRASQARIGLSISKKSARRAVDRTRIKRVIREAFRTHRNRLPAVDVVVMIRPAASQATNDQLFRALFEHWSRIRELSCARC